MANASQAKSQQWKSPIGYSCVACRRWTRYFHHSFGRISTQLFWIFRWNTGSFTTTSLRAWSEGFVTNCKLNRSSLFFFCSLFFCGFSFQLGEWSQQQLYIICSQSIEYSTWNLPIGRLFKSKRSENNEPFYNRPKVFVESAYKWHPGLVKCLVVHRFS